MNRLRLVDAVHRAPKFGAGLSSVWMVVLCIVLMQVLNDSFGWVEDDHVRLGAGLAGGVVLMMLGRLLRTGKM